MENLFGYLWKNPLLALLRKKTLEAHDCTR